jgi:hypothetical protein
MVAIGAQLQPSALVICASHLPSNFGQVFENTGPKFAEKWRENPLRLAYPGFQRCPSILSVLFVGRAAGFGVSLPTNV